MAAKPEAAAEEAAPKSKKKLFIIIGVVVLVLILGGAGAAFMLLKKNSDEDGHEEAKATKPVEPPVFTPLDVFTVNLQPDQGEQYLQVKLSLKIANHGVEEQVKSFMPEIRNRVLLLLSNKKASEINTAEGKQILAEELRDDINATLGYEPSETSRKKRPRKSDPEEASPPVKAVLFESFIIQ